MSFIDELKRRNVFRVGVAYIVASWVVLQVADLVLEAIGAPDWVLLAMMMVVALGFVAAVVVAWAYELTPEGIRKESEVDRSRSTTHLTAKKLDKITIALLIAVAAIVVFDRLVPDSADTPGQPAMELTGAEDKASPPPATGTIPALVEDARQSVAVLPFVNMSDDQQNEYFSDGISEELLNVLVRIKGLRVPSRTSSFTFKGSNKNLTEIGRALKVDHILEGSVRKAGDRIRVTAQLIDVRTDTHLWSDTYTRKVDDIFAVQDEIAQAIVSALKLTLTGADQQNLGDHSTTNVEAYNKYLLGRHLWNQRTGQSLLAATEPLREAVELDPGYDQAWAALADAYVLIPEYGAGSISEFISLARNATQKALQINPDSARALTTSGYIKAMYDYDIESAFDDFERAISLEPGYATAHQWYGEILAVVRRDQEAIKQVQIAIDADPLAPILRHVMGWLLSYGEQPEAAFVHYERALELDPHFPGTFGNLVLLHLRLGHYDLARQRANEHGQVLGFNAAPGLAVIDAVENPDLRNRAVEMLEASEFYIDGVMANGLYFILMGEEELALQSLERAFEAGDPYAIHVNRVRLYDPLRENPRFQALLKKMNLLP